MRTHPSTFPNRKVLLIGWDAADWKVVDPLLNAGKMPNLARLIDQGVIGNIAAASVRSPIFPARLILRIPSWDRIAGDHGMHPA